MANQETLRPVTPRTPTQAAREEYNPWARWVNLALGVWLFFSAFIWAHTDASRTNTWIVGLLIAAAAVGAFFWSPARYINTALSVWLFFSTLVIEHVSAASLWNNLIVAVAVFIFSLIPSRFEAWRPRRRVPA